MIDEEKYLKFMKIRIPKLPKAYICIEKNPDINNTARFHILSDYEKFSDYSYPIALFDSKYCYKNDDEIYNYRGYFDSNQLKALDKFLRKCDKYGISNWMKIIDQWYLMIDSYFSLVAMSPEQPNYAKLNIEYSVFGKHLSEFIKVCEFGEYDVGVYKEESYQPHFHVISRKRDFKFAAMIFSLGVYYDHFDERRDKFSLVECLEFNDFMDIHWEEIKNAYLENNKHIDWLFTDNTKKEIKQMKKPSYANMCNYYYMSREHADLEL